MEITIPSHQERIYTRYKDELAKLIPKFTDAIENGDLQTNYKDHRWVVAWLGGAPDIHDELFNHLHHVYLLAGWVLERSWGDEGTEYEGKLMAINLFVANRDAIEAAQAKDKELRGE